LSSKALRATRHDTTFKAEVFYPFLKEVVPDTLKVGAHVSPISGCEIAETISAWFTLVVLISYCLHAPTQPIRDS
jgi:hypothetical protein